MPVWLWTISAFIGLAVSLWAFVDAWMDYRITEHARADGVVRFASRSDMYQEVFMVMAMIVASILGVIAAVPITLLSGVTVDGLVLFIALITASAIYRRRTRHVLMQRVGLRMRKTPIEMLANIDAVGEETNVISKDIRERVQGLEEQEEINEDRITAVEEDRDI